jgi:hypothetical protein
MSALGKISIIACFISHLAIGCVVAESDETSEQSSDLGRAEGDGMISIEAAKVQQGDYDVIALSPKISQSISDSVLALLEDAHGDEVLAWTVEEEDGPRQVFAYPRDRYDIAGEMTGMVDPRLDALRASVRSTITSDHGTLVNTCHTLWNHGFFCNGAGVTACGPQGTSDNMNNLGNYGFDNLASCYLTGNTSNAISIYNGTNRTSYIGKILDDWWSFDSTYNDKASSAVNYY